MMHGFARLAGYPAASQISDKGNNQISRDADCDRYSCAEPVQRPDKSAQPALTIALCWSAVPSRPDSGADLQQND